MRERFAKLCVLLALVLLLGDFALVLRRFAPYLVWFVGQAPEAAILAAALLTLLDKTHR